MPRTDCPACHTKGDPLGYALNRIPVNSVRLYGDEASAKAVPQGELALYGCPSCGFVWNAKFDSELADYSAGYESTQGFSRTYRQFAEAQARELVETYGLGGKTVLEIGCGHGEFLATLCQSGIGHGIGYDPAALAERTPGVPSGELTIHAEAVTADSKLPPANLLICRNTLEHIADVRAFVELLRKVLGDGSQTPIFIQVPSWDRIAKTGAFWDIYYEHCSYFSQASLSRLFEASGFTVTSCKPIFDGQYLDLRAVPNALSDANEPETSKVEIEAVMEQRQRWVEHFAENARHSRKTILWGGGSKAVALLTSINFQDSVLAVVDINPYKHGTFLPATGHPVIAPEQLAGHQFDQVLLMNGIYRDEVQAELDRLNINAELLVFD